MNGELLRFVQVARSRLCCGLFACCVCGVCFGFLSPHPLPQSSHTHTHTGVSLSDLYPGSRQADTFTIHARLQYLMAKFVVAVAVTTPHCGRVQAVAQGDTVERGGECDSVTGCHGSAALAVALLSSSYSARRAVSRCHLSLSFRFGKLFFRPLDLPLPHLAFVDSIIRQGCSLLALC